MGTRFLAVQAPRALVAKLVASTRTALLQDRTPGAKRLAVSGFTVLVKPSGARPALWSVTIAMADRTEFRELALFDRSTKPKPLTKVLMKAALRLARTAVARS